MLQAVEALVAELCSVADRPLGNLVGANGWPFGDLLSRSDLEVPGACRPNLNYSGLWAYL